jgi:hypothetical protein
VPTAENWKERFRLIVVILGSTFYEDDIPITLLTLGIEFIFSPELIPSRFTVREFEN